MARIICPPGMRRDECEEIWRRLEEVWDGIARAEAAAERLAAAEREGVVDPETVAAARSELRRLYREEAALVAKLLAAAQRAYARLAPTVARRIALERARVMGVRAVEVKTVAAHPLAAVPEAAARGTTILVRPGDYHLSSATVRGVVAKLSARPAVSPSLPGPPRAAPTRRAAPPATALVPGDAVPVPDGWVARYASAAAGAHGWALRVRGRCVDLGEAVILSDAGCGVPGLPEVPAAATVGVEEAVVEEDVPFAVEVSGGVVRVWSRNTRRPVGLDVPVVSGVAVLKAPDPARLVEERGYMFYSARRVSRDVYQALLINGVPAIIVPPGVRVAEGGSGIGRQLVDVYRAKIYAEAILAAGRVLVAGAAPGGVEPGNPDVHRQYRSLIRTPWVRVWLDEDLVLRYWSPSLPVEKYPLISAGKPSFRVDTEPRILVGGTREGLLILAPGSGKSIEAAVYGEGPTMGGTILVEKPGPGVKSPVCREVGVGDVRIAVCGCGAAVVAPPCGKVKVASIEHLVSLLAAYEAHAGGRFVASYRAGGEATICTEDEDPGPGDIIVVGSGAVESGWGRAAGRVAEAGMAIVFRSGAAATTYKVTGDVKARMVREAWLGYVRGGEVMAEYLISEPVVKMPSSPSELAKMVGAKYGHGGPGDVVLVPAQRDDVMIMMEALSLVCAPGPVRGREEYVVCAPHLGPAEN